MTGARRREEAGHDHGQLGEPGLHRQRPGEPAVRAAARRPARGRLRARSTRSGSASSPTPRSASAARPARWPARSGTRSRWTTRTATRDAIGLSGMSYDNTGQLGANTWRHVAFIEQAAPSTCRCPASGCPARRGTRRRTRPSPSRATRDSLAEGAGQRAQRRGADASSTRRPAQSGDREIRWLMSLGRLQALHARRLPRRLPDRGAVPHRVRHRRRPGRHLQRLRLLRAGLPVRGHRPAQGRRPGLQVHDVLRPADRRADAGVRDRLPDPVDPVRRPRRAAGAGRRPAGDAEVAGRGDGAALRAGRERRRRRETGRSSCCSTSRRSTACRRTRSSPRGTCRRCGGPPPRARR